MFLIRILVALVTKAKKTQDDDDGDHGGGRRIKVLKVALVDLLLVSVLLEALMDLYHSDEGAPVDVFYFISFVIVLLVEVMMVWCQDMR
jgi:hypothetical protein